MNFDIDGLLSRMGFDGKTVKEIKKGKTELIYENTTIYPIIDIETFCINYLPHINVQVIEWIFNRI
jgi:hypothetical protein